MLNVPGDVSRSSVRTAHSCAGARRRWRAVRPCAALRVALCAVLCLSGSRPSSNLTGAAPTGRRGWSVLWGVAGVGAVPTDARAAATDTNGELRDLTAAETAAAGAGGASDNTAGAARVMNVVVEGWRDVPHSYAVVSQFLELELLQRTQDVRLFHVDAPLMRAEWGDTAGAAPLFDEVRASALARIPAPPAGLRRDATLRMSMPLRTTHDGTDGASPSALVLFATTEHKVVPEGALLEGEVPLRYSSAVFATPSRWSARGLQAAGVAASRIAVLPHGVDTGLFRPAADTEARQRARQRFRLPEDAFVFLHIGAMTPNKRVDLILSAFEQLSVDEATTAVLVLKGLSRVYGDVASGVLSNHSSLINAGKIMFVDEALSFAELAELYRSADAYVAPYAAEGFNLPVLEAVASGLPVVVTRGGPTDEFTTERFAVYVDSTEVEYGAAGETRLDASLPSLVNGMLMVLRDAAFREAARASGPHFVRDGFTWAHAADALLDILRSLPVGDPAVWDATERGPQASLARLDAPSLLVSQATLTVQCDLQDCSTLHAAELMDRTGDSVGCVAAEFGVLPVGDGCPVGGLIAWASPDDACSPIDNAEELAGAVAVVVRGNCTFTAKATRVQKAGAVALVVLDPSDELRPLGAAPTERDAVEMAVVSSSSSSAAAIRACGAIKISVPGSSLYERVAAMSAALMDTAKQRLTAGRKGATQLQRRAQQLKQLAEAADHQCCAL